MINLLYKVSIALTNFREILIKIALRIQKIYYLLYEYTKTFNYHILRQNIWTCERRNIKNTSPILKIFFISIFQNSLHISELNMSLCNLQLLFKEPTDISFPLTFQVVYFFFMY